MALRTSLMTSRRPQVFSSGQPHGPGQIIPAANAHLAVKQSCILKREKDLLQELGRDLLALRDILDLQHGRGVAFWSRFRQADHGS